MATKENSAPTQASSSALYLAAFGFALWGLGWFVLIPNHESQTGWSLEFLGPFLIAIAILMRCHALAHRMGVVAVALAVFGALSIALSTALFAVDPHNLEHPEGVTIGYGGYAVGLLLGFFSAAAVFIRKEAAFSAAARSGRQSCPTGCDCISVVHASFGALAASGVGLLVWGLGFLHMTFHPEGSEFGWCLSAAGSAAVTLGLAVHYPHLHLRFGRGAAVTGIASAAIWSFGYLLEAISPEAGVLSSWYNDLFFCYGFGHVLTAISLLAVVRRQSGAAQ